MIVSKLRFWIQNISFLLLTYGKYLNIRFGHFLPCFSCPYVGSCAGNCYLMALQGSQWGLELPFTHYLSIWGWWAIGMFLSFSALAILLNKIWCGWICPFGTLQDWVTKLRIRLNIRSSELSWRARRNIRPIKYILLGLLLLIPVFIANLGWHDDLSLPFCQICPAKVIMPVFNGNTSYFAIDQTNYITTIMTSMAIIITALFIIGMFFIDRFFCYFCPMLALISLFEKIGLVRLSKNVHSCKGCGNCKRACPMDIKSVHDEKEKENVLDQDCIQCFQCAEHCPSKDTLQIKIFNKTIYSSTPYKRNTTKN